MNGINNSNSLKKIIGERLQKARKDAGFTRDALCEYVSQLPDSPAQKAADGGLQSDTLKQWEYGKNSINLAWLPAICKALRCDVGYLFGSYEEKTWTTARLRADTGLPETAICNLEEICQEATPLKEAIYTLVDDLLDNFFLRSLAVAYQKYKSAAYAKGTYIVTNESGDFVDMLDGDISMMVLQNAFSRFAVDASRAEKSEYSRSSIRKQWNRLTEEEKADIMAQAKLDLERGK